MFESFATFMFTFISKMLATIINILTTPFMTILNTVIPNFSSYITYINQYFGNYIFKGAQFIKMCILNTTGINNASLMLLFSCVALSIALSGSIFILKSVLNIWKLFRGGKTGDSK